MATNISTITLGRILLQSGIGVPTHQAPIGSQFTDISTTIIYVNKNGISEWDISVDTNTISIDSTTSAVTINSNLLVSSFSADTIYSGGTNLTDVISSYDTFITGGTFNSGTTSVDYFGTGNQWSDFSVDLSVLSASLSADTYVTGGTVDYIDSDGTLTLNKNNGVSDIITGFTDVNTTGATIDNAGLITFTKNDGNTYLLSLSGTDLNDTYVSGFTYDGSNNLTISQSDNQPDLTVNFNTFTGLTVNGDLDATNILSGGTNIDELFLKVSEFDIYSGNVSTILSTKTDNTDFSTHTGDTTIHFTKGDILLSELGSSAHTHPISEIVGLQAELDSKIDTVVTGFTMNNGNYDLTIKQNQGVSDLTVNLGDLSNDVHVTGGTYDINTGIVTFTNNSGNTFDVDGFTSGMTDSFTTGSTLVGYDIQFSSNLYGDNFYNVDLTSIFTGKTDNTDFSTHTGDTTIHFTKGDILLSELGSSAHTHTLSEITDFAAYSGNVQTILDEKLDITIFDSYTASTFDVFITGGTFTDTTATLALTNNTGGTFNVSGFTSVPDLTSTGGTIDIVVSGLSTNLELNPDAILPVFLNVHNQSGVDLSKGDSVYISGTHPSGKPTVGLSDSTDSNKIPSIGLIFQDIVNGDEGKVIISGELLGIPTNTYTTNDTLYVSTGGTLSNVQPIGLQTIQNIGIVSKVHATNGSILVMGAGRKNALPNLIQNNLWVGDANGVPQEYPLSAITTQFRFEDTLITTGNTLTTISTYTGLTSDTSRFMVNYLTAHKDGTDYGFFKRTLALNNVGGVITIEMVTFDFDEQTIGGLEPTDVTYSSTGDTVLVQVTGDNSTTYDWTSTWEVVSTRSSINDSINNSFGNVLKIYSTANRPASPNEGLTIIDSDLGYVIYFFNGGWINSTGGSE